MAQQNILTTPPAGAETYAGTGEILHPANAHAFPPFEAHNFLAQLIWLALAFGLLYYLMDKVALPRIRGILHDRATRLSADLDAAQGMKAEADAAAVAYETSLRQAQAKAREIAQSNRDTLAGEADARRKVLEAELNTKLAASEATIRERTGEAMGSVRAIAGEAASAIVERLTGTAPDQASLERVLDQTATAH